METWLILARDLQCMETSSLKLKTVVCGEKGGERREGGGGREEEGGRGGLTTCRAAIPWTLIW